MQFFDLRFLLIIIFSLNFGHKGQAFVLMGPGAGAAGGTPENTENTLNGVLGGFGAGGVNLRDDLGVPQQLDEFFRWNTPHLTYGVDATFYEFFGAEGVIAVSEAMRVLNDFFKPEDGSYTGVTELNLARHGYGKNFNTTWINTTAQNERLIDIKSLILGNMVNYLGLGNPYRYAFTATGIYPNAQPGVPGLSFEVSLKNYDPISKDQSDIINGVKYSYRLVHDQAPGFVPFYSGAGAVTDNISTVNLDMEEYTSDTTGNAYTAVSAITDAFYGNTDIVWFEPPSAFYFGVYYDGQNAMGGQYQPRHALTYDDAGGLKYLYSKDTIAMEYSPYTLVSTADFSGHPDAVIYNLPPTSDSYENRRLGVFPGRNAAGLPTSVSAIHPLSQFINPFSRIITQNANLSLSSYSRNGTGFFGANVGMMDWAYRGGVDQIRFDSLSYDSLLDISLYPTNYIWSDTFMTNASVGQVVGNSPGGVPVVQPAASQYFTQEVGRNVNAPDFIFSAEAIAAVGAVDVAFERSGIGGPAGAGSNIDVNGSAPFGSNVLPATPDFARVTLFNAWENNLHTSVARAVGSNTGPGTWIPPIGPNAQFLAGGAIGIVFNNDFIGPGGFVVDWVGETSVNGNLIPQAAGAQMWAYIYGPGPNDYVRFPTNSKQLQYENTILPASGPPEIVLLSDDGGVTAIEPNSLSRTTEDLTIIGKNFRSVTALEIVDVNENVLQVLYPISEFIESDTRIVVPSRQFGYGSEGSARRVRVWNTLGPSEFSADSFSVITGPPLIESTSFDGTIFDRGEALEINGSGFKSKQLGPLDGNSTVTHVRLESAAGEPVYPGTGEGFGIDISDHIDVISDSKLIIRANGLPSITDGAGRRIRVSRGNVSSLSIKRDDLIFFNYITVTPNINTVSYINEQSGLEIGVNASSPLRRDNSLSIRGVGLVGLVAVELIQENGVAYDPPILGYFEESDVDDNGTQIRLRSDSFTSNAADGFGSKRSKLKVTTQLGSALSADSFNVNIQPNDGTVNRNLEVGLAGLSDGSEYGINSLLWDYDPKSGDNLVFIGAGLKLIQSIYIVDANVTNPVITADTPVLEINDYGTPGVEVTDNSIKVNTQLGVFNNIVNASANSKTDYRRFYLVSDRDPVLTSSIGTQRVLIGTSPKFTRYDLNNTIAGNSANFRRDEHLMTVTGSGLELIDRIDMVDGEGLLIEEKAALIPPLSELNIVSGSTIEITGTAFNLFGNQFDTIDTGSRRLRIQTPWGAVISDNNATGSFTVSHTPVFQNTLSTTFAGGGFDGNSTFDINSTSGSYPNNLQPLIINGNNFKGVSVITFEDTGSTPFGPGEINVNPKEPPAGITFGNDGKSIVFSGQFLWNTVRPWLDSGGLINRRIELETIAGQEVHTLPIETDPDN